MEKLAFTPERLEMFRAKVNATNPRTFNDVVAWYQQQCGVSYGEAKRRAVKSHAKLYNEFCARGQRNAVTHRPAIGSRQTMSLHASTARVIQFRGL